jgi:hypothetical protein
MPNLEQIARRVVTLDAAQSPGGWTARTLRELIEEIDAAYWFIPVFWFT